MKKRLLVSLLAFTALVALALVPASSAAEPNEDALKAAVEKATEYLKKAQKEDGSWSAEPQNRGITGIVVTGLIRTGTKPEDEPAAKGVKFIEKLVNAKSGHIAGDDSKAGLINYTTSINILALNAANKGDKYKGVIGNATKYLKEYQWDEARGKKDDSDYYGGAGYAGDKSRPDLSNTAFFLEALKAAGVAKDDPAFKKAQVFISRCQNFESEYNTAPWAKKNNDGSFVYTGANGGENRRSDDTKNDLGGYGSMTYAGVKSMIYCGIAKDDKRVQKALEWIGKNYTLDANPGMPEVNSQRGLYYYYHTFAKTMDALGVDEFTDAKGVKHDWRADLLAAIAKRQKPDGSFVNDNDRWMEGDKNLVTGYALMALSYCKKK
ncbi:signal peptide protein : Prenyltransferase/squalene oxidase OS=Isosphaera pallida (strain ATCC 43644 / DSM 9630 / IS1B) GN=Isop_2195 PE=4 SV=1: Prenyltrans_2: Prenyltrans_1 [Gemmata massiliana]|uniref:Squalene cyclase C-terminal domain-containing protein n=1 Tax=Gemmata massiliana TaxID=1210884 RepID=A0A6P2D7B5_9BACT|nr:prenyltransferase/squalene oxidase repeat-containing protein [Gemmata massiliana]VTR96893.1 signal peptide protein : Prenyltransferase/squalene oxidase OS=Isosphaera pallida (strain ATCC 43644 / DSM 9630 / IS1B) GN=Isop_2195 PE=4 SV=1: Prenyltrans_2: Prenyltrans_1 [Gemmata massiliana]